MRQIIFNLIHPNPSLYVFYVSICLAILLYLYKQTYLILKNSVHKKLVILIFFLIILIYFNVNTFLGLFFLFTFPILIQAFLFKPSTNRFVSYVVNFLIITQTYIIIGILFSPQIALYTLLFAYAFIIFFNLSKIKKNIKNFSESTKHYFYNLNILDVFIFSLAFTISSQPQSHWDAVMSNLYIAKWYVIHNSFSPIIESISTLFPQNSIVYYSFFYHLGGLKSLQVSFLFPLILLIFFIKYLFNKFKISTNYQLLAYSLLLTPVVIFQSSNGYYDQLLMFICLIGAFSCYEYIKSKNKINLFCASFLFGFATAIKYLPVVFFFLPLLLIILFEKKNKLRTLFISVSLLFFPLLVWCIRTYLFTGSPVFPFAQYLFPTPNLWTPSDILENNFMIQTTLKSKQWLLGGFFYYPLVSFLNTPKFLEATPGYPTIIYILLAIPGTILLFKTLLSIKEKKYQIQKLIFIYLFLAYFLVGLATRYYRYLWPYQFIFFLAVIIYYSKLYPKINFRWFKPIIIIVLLFNTFNIYKYFRGYPIYTKQLFKPDYYHLVSSENNPITFLNRITNEDPNIKVLDASKNFLGRLHLSASVYQCSWYWLGISSVFSNTNNNPLFESEILNKFDYVVTSNPYDLANNYCTPLIKNQRSLLKQIYEDKDYFIYQLIK